MNPREEFRESFSERKRTPAPFPIRSKAKKGLDFSKSGKDLKILEVVKSFFRNIEKFINPTAFDVEKSNSVDLTGDSFKFVKPLEILTSKNYIISLLKGRLDCS